MRTSTATRVAAATIAALFTLGACDSDDGAGVRKIGESGSGSGSGSGTHTGSGSGTMTGTGTTTESPSP